MLKRYCFLFSAMMLLFVTSVFGESITFTFANGQITGTSPKYYEFDVMANGASGTTRLGDNQVYINYSTTGFGLSIFSNGKITVTKGTLLQGDTGDPLYIPYYTLVGITDNTDYRVSIAYSYDFSGSPGLANLLPSSPTQLIHVKIQISIESSTAGLSFQGSLMTGEQYESDNTTIYSPVTATDTDDSSLPVQLTSVMATADPESGVTITWQTQSETDCAGFRVWRSESREGSYEPITTSLIPGQGNSSTACLYTFNDAHVQDGVIYWYKVEEVSTKGESRFYGPVSVMGVRMIPTEFGLSQNYPNPFNPVTTIDYQLPEDSQVSLYIYDVLGKEVRKLIQEHMQAGYHKTIWDGFDEGGRPASSGIYFIYFQVGSFRQVRKMTLLR